MSHNFPLTTRFGRHRRLRGAAVSWTLAVLILTGCSAQSLPPLGGEPLPETTAGTDVTTGCPTPTPSDDLGLEQNGGSANQSTQGAATRDENLAASEQEAIPSLAEREAMLDRANQGPLRPEVRTDGAIAAPDPSLGLTEALSATISMSDSSGLSAGGATPTPCP